MNEFIVLLVIFFLSNIGFLIIYSFNLLPKTSVLSVMGYSYGLGVGIIGTQLYIYSRFSITWTKETIIIPWVVATIIFIIQKRKAIKLPKIGKPKLHIFSIILVSAIICCGTYVLFEALLRPVSAWDAWAIWLLKSKVFFIDNGIKPGILNYVKSDYPLIISLLGTFIYIVLGRINDTSVLLAFFGFYFFLSILFFSILKERFGTVSALIFTLFLVTTQTIIRQGGRIEAGQADLAVGYFAFISFTLLIKYLKSSNKKTLLLLNIFLAFTGLVKFDGIPITIVIALFILIHIFKKKLYIHLYLLLLWIIPILDWEFYKKLNNVTKTYFAGHVFTFSFVNIISVIKQEFFELINVKSWNMLWIVYFYTLLCGMKKDYETLVLHTLILTQLVVYTFLYFFTVGNSPESSFERLLVHIAPLALYTVAVYTNNLFRQMPNISFGKTYLVKLLNNNKL